MKKKYLIAPIVLSALMATSCSDDPKSGTVQIDKAKVDRSILVYAVNHNNLSYDFLDDLDEMERAVGTACEDCCQVMIYKTDSRDSVGLYRLARNYEGSADLELIKRLPRNTTSTDPNRISEVLQIAVNQYPQSRHDLVFWGHGMSWKPFFTDHELNGGNSSDRAKMDMSELYSYGGEYNPTGANVDYTDLDDLASAVPDGVFDLIWFDCCYMSAIEVYWEFKDKCKYMVAYPSEVWSSGMDYSKVLPQLMKKDRDICKAAEAFYTSYSEDYKPVTIAVADMEKIYDVAVAARLIAEAGNVLPNPSGLLNYSREDTPFYDFRQLWESMAMLNSRPDLITKFHNALGSFIIYQAASPVDFNMKYWNTDCISGVSAHLVDDSNSAEENFYRSLGWYKWVYN